VLTGGKYDGRLVDSWGAGVVMYMLLAGAFPFLSFSEERLKPVMRMQAMLPRIIGGCPVELPHPVSLARQCPAPFDMCPQSVARSNGDTMTAAVFTPAAWHILVEH